MCGPRPLSELWCFCYRTKKHYNIDIWPIITLNMENICVVLSTKNEKWRLYWVSCLIWQNNSEICLYFQCNSKSSKSLFNCIESVHHGYENKIFQKETGRSQRRKLLLISCAWELKMSNYHSVLYEPVKWSFKGKQFMPKHSKDACKPMLPNSISHSITVWKNPDLIG